MSIEVWQRSVGRHLAILLDAVRQELAEGYFGGWFERVVPWSMDDGEGLVRLTVLLERSEQGFDEHGSPLMRHQLRIVLDADAKTFGMGLNVSRFADLASLHHKDRARLDTVPPTTAGLLIEALRIEHNGGPLYREHEGSLSFVLVL